MLSSQWISLTDHLPPIDTRVLVRDSSSRIHEAIYTGGFFTINDSTLHHSCFVDWRPIPKELS